MESANRIAGISGQSCHRAPLGKPVRFGDECPLSGVKPDLAIALRNVRYDPKRTLTRSASDVRRAVR